MMEELGFSFDETTKQWRQGTNTIKKLREKINSLSDENIVDKNVLESMLQTLEN